MKLKDLLTEGKTLNVKLGSNKMDNLQALIDAVSHGFNLDRPNDVATLKQFIAANADKLPKDAYDAVSSVNAGSFM